MTNVNQPQFDSLLGGSEIVPNEVYVSQFIKDRMEEVVMLTEAIKESPFRGQTFQRLPKHMRRRQMSHYIKRLPRRLQRPYLMTLKEGPPAPTKRPSRKYRRRPGNMLTEYNRRQKKFVWLETHIWHAKRFHMTQKWGYKLPERPTNKSFKACYRAASEHCLLTDISYYNCIELKGPQEKLLDGLRQCTSCECGLTFGAKMFLSGCREGSVTLFHPNSYPFKVIGNVNFMWEPGSDKGDRKIWIWVHPLMHNEIIECFNLLFDMKPVKDNSNLMKDEVNGGGEIVVEDFHVKNKKKKKKEIKSEQIKLEPKNIPFTNVPKFQSKDEKVVMSLLKDTLNRFQLIGPLSQPIIVDTFKVASVSSPTNEESILEIPCKRQKLDDDVEIIDEVDEKVEGIKENWWVEFYKDQKWKTAWETQKNFFTKLSSCSKPSDAAPGMILSLLIEDPRLRIPMKKEKSVPKSQESCQISFESVNMTVSQSPMWDPDIRDKVSLSKLSTHEINEARSKKIVPGFDANDVIPDDKQSRIPILLVQRPGHSDSSSGKLGFGSGWDIISPAGFGMPIWLGLILRGARTGGLREFESFQLESNNLNTYIQPDSAAGDAENLSKFVELKNRYFKLPPNKRANYVKLGVLSPFYPLWKVLVKDWTSKSINNFSVLRNKKKLLELSQVCKFSKSQKKDFSWILNDERNGLIPVVIECLGKGNPVDLAMICLPNKEDLLGDKLGLAEKSHVDENETTRKILKSEHKRLLKSLKRKRRRDRSKLKEEFADNLPNKLKWKDILKTNSAPSQFHSEEYKAKMQNLWLPDPTKINSIADTCSRRILGFIVKGGFSFSKSFGVGVGYVTLPGLVELLDVCRESKSKLLVLVRNRNQIHYRFAKLRIVVD